MLRRCVLWIWAWLRSWWRAGREEPARFRRGAHATPLCAPVARFKPAPPKRSGGRPKPPWAVQEVMEMHAMGTMSVRGLMAAFNRLHAAEGVSVCSGTVQNWIKKHSEQAQRVRAATRNRFPAFTRSNLRWCLDGTGKADATGVVHFILGIIDHGSRFAPVLRTLERASAWAILARLFEAIDRFGKPQCIRTDNAPVFHSRVFRAVLAAAGIRHEFSEPGKPWQNGRIERLFLTLKLALNQVVPLDGSALDNLLDEFRLWYNEVRPHQHLHCLTPSEAWRGVDPYAEPPKEVLEFEGWDGLLRGFYMRR